LEGTSREQTFAKSGKNLVRNEQIPPKAKGKPPQGDEASTFFRDSHGGRRKPQGGWQLSKEASLSSGSLILCRASVEMDGLPFSKTKKPMRGDSVEARDQGQRGEYLGEGQG
jgi:hypothetical protein